MKTAAPDDKLNDRSEGWKMGGKKRRISLVTKTSLLLCSVILLVSLGLVAISYTVHARQIDEIYQTEVNQAARAALGAINTDAARYVRDTVLSEAFQTIRADAEKKGYERIIQEWMSGQPSSMGKDVSVTDYSLYDEYKALCSELDEVRNTFGLAYVYIQYDLDGVTYHIADPSESLLSLGTAEAPIEEFRHYGDNASIPATVYRNDAGWLCTACEPFRALWDDSGEAAGYVGADMDMNHVMKQRHVFLVNSALFVAVFTIAAAGISVLLLNRTAVRPIKRIAMETRRFAGIRDGYSPEDVMQADISSRDEIGDLYRDIQEMQRSIIDSTRRLTEAAKEQERINTELQLAAEIQSSALPHGFRPFPERNEFELYASMTPAKEVGGDFYDYFPVDENHLALVIADVSGKGIPGALFMMSAKLLISAQTMSGASPAAVLANVNRQICSGNRKSKMFVTVWLGILDISSGVLTCANAGHEYPFLRRTGDQFEIVKDPHGLVAGGIKTTVYQEYQLALRPGDTIFLYTDGVPDATDEHGKRFGMERLKETLNRTGAPGCREILDGVLSDVLRFTGNAEQFDDLTMLCLRYKNIEEE